MNAAQTRRAKYNTKKQTNSKNTVYLFYLIILLLLLFTYLQYSSIVKTKKKFNLLYKEVAHLYRRHRYLIEFLFITFHSFIAINSSVFTYLKKKPFHGNLL